MNIYIMVFLLILIFNVVKLRKSLIVLQKNLYNEDNRYTKWIINNKKDVFFTLDLLSVITILIAYLFNNEITFVLIIIASIFYILEGLRLLNKKAAHINKNEELFVTKRIKRLTITATIIVFLPIILYLIDHDNIILMVLIEGIITYFSYFIILICLFINIPIESSINKYNKIKAIQKMDTLNKLDSIGIAGSFGKTSTKNILSSIFNTKYTTKETIKNINTEHALISTINKYLSSNDQIFIAEMGGYKKNEIGKLADLVKPKYGIITYIDLAHIDTFGSIENIVKTKFELIEALPFDGLAVLNMDDINQTSYTINNRCRKIWIGIDNKNADIIATDIKYSKDGSKFNVKFKNDKEKYPFETKLLGKYNIYNILSSIAIAKDYGFTIKELQHIIKLLNVSDARLELIDLGYMYVINDINNNNPLGVKVALEVLDNMDGIKVIITAGMFNNDLKEKRLNQMFGNSIAGICDYIILVNPKKSRKIFDGIMENGYDKDRLFVVNNLKEAYNLIKGFNEKKKIYTLLEGNLEED